MHRTSLFALTFLALTGCASEAPTPASTASATGRRVWVGPVEASDARIAVVANGDAAIAYVCGGAKTYGTMSAWYRLARGDDGRFVARHGATTLVVTDRGGTLVGELRDDDGGFRAFSAAMADPGATVELYGAIDDGCRTGAIYEHAADGRASLQGTWCSSTGAYAQVTPARSADGDHGGGVSVVVAGSGKTLTLAVVEP